MAYDGTLKFDTSIDGSGFSSGLAALGKGAAGAIAGVAAGLAAAGGAAIKVGMDFEAGMSKVEAISGASAQEMEQLTAKAKEMGASTKFSATESAAAFEYMAMAGWKTGDMLDGIEGIMNLAAASGEDLARTSDIVTDALTAFGLQASDSAHFADVLAKASSSSNTNVGLMGSTFKYVAPLAGAMGYSIEDTAVAIGLMANAGIKGEQAGTALRATLTRLANPPKSAAAAMEQLGISIKNADGSVKPLGDTIKDLRTAFDGLSEAEKTEYASSIAGTEAMSGLLAVVNASDSDFENLTKKIYDADGAAKEMADTMIDNLSGSLTIIGSALEGLGIALYQNIQDPLQDVVQNAIGYVEQLTTAFESGGLLALVAEIGTIFADIAVQVADAAPAMIDAAVLTIQSFLQGIQENIPQLADSAVEIVTSLATGIIELAPEMILTAVELFLAFVQGLGEALPELIPVALEAVMTLALGLIDNIDKLTEAAIQLMAGLAEGIISSLPTILEKAPIIIQKLVDALVTNIPKLGAAALQIIVALGKALIDNLPLIVQAANEIVLSLASGLIQFAWNLASAAFELANNIKNTFWDVDWLSIGRDIISGIASGISNAGGMLMDAARDAAKNAFESAKEFLGIHSPSTLFRDQIGKNMMLGAAEGVTEAAPKLEKNLENNLSGIIAEMQDAILWDQASIAEGYASRQSASITNDSHDSKIEITVNYYGSNTPESDMSHLGRKLGKQIDWEMRSRGLVPT